MIGDGFYKTLKLHFFQTGGHMGCLYEGKRVQAAVDPIPASTAVAITGGVSGLNDANWNFTSAAV